MVIDTGKMRKISHFSSNRKWTKLLILLFYVSAKYISNYFKETFVVGEENRKIS